MRILETLMDHIEDNYEAAKEIILGNCAKPEDMGDNAWQAYMMPLNDRMRG